MATILSIIIFIIYIGLGLPDSSMGSSWPAVFADLKIDVGMQSVVCSIISLGTLIASSQSAKLMRKMGTPTVVAVSTLLTALALLGFALSPSILYMCLCAIPLGLGAGAVDTALNAYVANRYSAFQMNLLHAFYGVGISITPYIFSAVLKDVSAWRTGFFVLFLIQSAITIISFASFPVWKKADDGLCYDNATQDKPYPFKKMIKNPLVVISWVVFFATCSLEFLFGTWACTFLVNQRGLTESQGAFWVSFYYVGITLGRFGSGLLSKKLNCGQLLLVCGGIIGLGVVGLFFALPPTLCGLCLLLVGLGNGPTFPNLTHATPYVVGKEYSSDVIGSQMVASCLGILLIPPLSGIILQEISFSTFPILASVCFLAMVFGLLIFQKLLKKQSKSFFKVN